MSQWFLILGGIHVSSSSEENQFGLDINAGQLLVHVDCFTRLQFMKGKKENHRARVPLGTRVVMDCLNVCETPTYHHIFFDNFFTSYDLVANLKKPGSRATGTIRANRMQGCVMKSVESMKKGDRGSYDYRSDGDIEMVRWNDNSVVNFCSNACGVDPVRQMKRWVKSKGSVMVSQPHVVAKYNKGMGGVHFMDRALSDYRPRIRGKKWYWPQLINAVNLLVVFSW